MQILLIGSDIKVNEAIQRLEKSDAALSWVVDSANEEAIMKADLIIDFDFDADPSRAYDYNKLDKTFLVSAVQIQLAEIPFMTAETPKCNYIGMNALPTFIDRPLWELTLADQNRKAEAEKTMEKLGVDYLWVADRVGMVSPRVILMIINEACYTVQEGTADMASIDQAMKLGTNYPMGPFEWADKIGINNVYETLEAIYEDTKDERYKICPLLKTQYLKQAKFLS